MSVAARLDRPRVTLVEVDGIDDLDLAAISVLGRALRGSVPDSHDPTEHR